MDNDTELPPGTYTCRVAEVRAEHRADLERWVLHLVVGEGPHAGKLAGHAIMLGNRWRASHGVQCHSPIRLVDVQHLVMSVEVRGN